MKIRITIDTKKAPHAFAFTLRAGVAAALRRLAEQLDWGVPLNDDTKLPVTVPSVTTGTAEIVGFLTVKE